MIIHELLENRYKIDTIKELFENDFHNDRHFLWEIIQNIKDNAISNIVIWGGYPNALKLKRFLAKQGIDVLCAAVNREYLDMHINKIKTEKGFPIKSIEEVISDNEYINLIIDFSYFKYSLVDHFKEKIQNIYVGDIMGVFIFDNPYIISAKQLKENEGYIETVYNELCDDKSKSAYLDLICQKMFGFYNKAHDNNQYFDSSLIKLDKNSIFVDCGAYNGDTVSEFAKYTNCSYERIYAIEMNPINYELLCDNCNSIRNCVCINCGVGENEQREWIICDEGPASHIEDNTDKNASYVQVNKLDNLIHERVDYIKMDVEGFELASIKGAQGIIEKYHPKLAICMYHKFEDLWTIPNAIKMIDNGYQLYFRNYHNSAQESVLYAI